MLLLLRKTPYSNSSIWFERKLLKIMKKYIKKGKLHTQTVSMIFINLIKIETLQSYAIHNSHSTHKTCK